MLPRVFHAQLVHSEQQVHVFNMGFMKEKTETIFVVLASLQQSL